MRLCDFLKCFGGEWSAVRIYQSGCEAKLLLSGTLAELNNRCHNDFNPLDGFCNRIWELSVATFFVNHDEILISVRV